MQRTAKQLKFSFSKTLEHLPHRRYMYILHSFLISCDFLDIQICLRLTVYFLRCLPGTYSCTHTQKAVDCCITNFCGIPNRIKQRVKSEHSNSYLNGVQCSWQQSVSTGEVHLSFIGSNLLLPNSHIVWQVLWWSSQSVCNVLKCNVRRCPLDVDVPSTILQCADIPWWVWNCVGVREGINPVLLQIVIVPLKACYTHWNHAMHMRAHIHGHTHTHTRIPPSSVLNLDGPPNPLVSPDTNSVNSFAALILNS